MTCNGCCQDNNCLAGTADNECGQNGGTCSNCAAMGQTCDPKLGCAGAPCGPGNCNGCCVGNKCLMGTDPDSCGQKGQQCQDCKATGTMCSPVVPGQPGGACVGQPSCSPANCQGCCTGNTCAPGTDQTVCGLAGQQCQDCRVIGAGATCNLVPPAGGVCRPPRCGPDNCKGCCLGDQCVDGSSDPNSCGVGGAMCAPCGANSMCVNGMCQGACDITICPTGCCINGICATGTQPNACGTGAQKCQNCQASPGEACINQACTVVCGPTSCPTGCCAGNTCVPGNQDPQCGTGGQMCKDCTLAKDVCSMGTCQPPVPPCDPMICPTGCCDAKIGCALGTTSDRCGSGGTACVNCTAMGSTCDTAVKPFVCENQQMTCPAPYTMCPGSVITPAPNVQHVCTDADLMGAHNSCADGQGSTACDQFFAFELMGAMAPCGKCLAPFNASFSQATGIFACAAPFLSGACNHSTGCAEDCLQSSCVNCPSQQAVQSCEAEVGKGQCSSFFGAAANCAIPALAPGGPAEFCSPVPYNGDYADWLLAVATHYCGP
jgi:hypothetical protein